MKSFPMLCMAVLSAGGASLIGACASKPYPAVAQGAKPIATATTLNPGPGPTSAPISMAEPKRESSVRLSAEELNRRGYVRDAFFDYDKYDVRPDQRETLAKDAEWLKDHPSVRIMVEGHCDERGTAQYNMALGEQRAQSVRDYLIQLGVDPSRIQIISYGKERPFAGGHDEQAWTQNRRDHFLITAG